MPQSNWFGRLCTFVGVVITILMEWLLVGPGGWRWCLLALAPVIYFLACGPLAYAGGYFGLRTFNLPERTDRLQPETPNWW